MRSARCGDRPGDDGRRARGSERDRRDGRRDPSSFPSRVEQHTVQTSNGVFSRFFPGFFISSELKATRRDAGGHRRAPRDGGGRGGRRVIAARPGRVGAFAFQTAFQTAVAMAPRAPPRARERRRRVVARATEAPLHPERRREADLRAVRRRGQARGVHRRARRARRRGVERRGRRRRRRRERTRRTRGRGRPAIHHRGTRDRARRVSHPRTDLPRLRLVHGRADAMPSTPARAPPRAVHLRADARGRARAAEIVQDGRPASLGRRRADVRRARPSGALEYHTGPRTTASAR